MRPRRQRAIRRTSRSCRVLSQLACTVIASALLAGTVGAQTFFWAGTNGDPATAGGGRWDLNDSVTWRESDPAGPLVKWTDHRSAVFQGAAGGAVTVADSLNVDALHFAATAGAFTISTTSGSVVIAGEGISCDSPHEQTVSIHQAMLNFSHEANAGGGSRGSHLHLASDALTTFSGSATAGRATMTNNGELQFAAQSSAGDAEITNTSIVIFLGEAHSGSAAIINQGQLTMQEHAHDFAAAAISNGGVLDLAAVAEEDAVHLGGLANATGSIVLLGRKNLTLAQLLLVDENVLSFDVGADASGSLTVTSLLVGAGAKKKSRINISDAGGLARGRRFRLIDWSAARWVSGVEVRGFSLDPLPPGFAGKLKIESKALWLEVAAKK